MKKSIFYVLAFTFGVSANAQHELSFSANAGFGKIQVVKPEFEFALTETKTMYKPTLGFDLNYSYNFKFVSLETGLNYNFIKGSQTEIFDLYKSAENITKVKAITDRTTHYINIPILINLKYNKFTIGAGASVGYRITNSKFTQVYNDDKRGTFIGGGNDLDKMDFGFNAQFGYAINKRFTLQAKIYRGLNDVSNGSEKGILNTLYQLDPLDRELRNQQVMLGLKIRLGKIKVPQ